MKPQGSTSCLTAFSHTLWVAPYFLRRVLGSAGVSSLFMITVLLGGWTGIKTDLHLNPLAFGKATTSSPQVLGEQMMWKMCYGRLFKKSIIDYINIKHDVYYNRACFSPKAFALPNPGDYPAAVCGREKAGRPPNMVENSLQDKLLGSIWGQG